MKIQYKLALIFSLVFMLSCEADDPLSFYGGTELLDLVESGWTSFRDGDYEESLTTFLEAKGLADEQTNSDTLLIHSTYGSIHSGIGWCNLRLLNADIAKENFIVSQGYELYSFGTSVGLMASYYELGNEIPMDIALINTAIEIGHWIFSSGMPEEFENDVTININDVRLLMAKSYYAKGDLSANIENETGALFWIVKLDSNYSYLSDDEPLSWYLYQQGSQEFDSLDEIILMIIRELERQVFPA